MSSAIKALSVTTGQPLLRLTGHTDEVTALALHPTRTGVLLSSSRDGTLREWNVAVVGSGEQQGDQGINSGGSSERCLAVHKLGRLLMSIMTPPEIMTAHQNRQRPPCCVYVLAAPQPRSPALPLLAADTDAAAAEPLDGREAGGSGKKRRRASTASAAAAASQDAPSSPAAINGPIAPPSSKKRSKRGSSSSDINGASTVSDTQPGLPEAHDLQDHADAAASDATSGIVVARPGTPAKAQRIGGKARKATKQKRPPRARPLWQVLRVQLSQDGSSSNDDYDDSGDMAVVASLHCSASAPIVMAAAFAEGGRRWIALAAGSSLLIHDAAAAGAVAQMQIDGKTAAAAVAAEDATMQRQQALVQQWHLTVTATSQITAVAARGNVVATGHADGSVLLWHGLGAAAEAALEQGGGSNSGVDAQLSEQQRQEQQAAWMHRIKSTTMHWHSHAVECLSFRWEVRNLHCQFAKMTYCWCWYCHALMHSRGPLYRKWIDSSSKR